MSTVKAKHLQVGFDPTADNNFTIYQPGTPDGTVRVAQGNADALGTEVLELGGAQVTVKVDFDVQGAFSVNGNDVWHEGNFDPTTKSNTGHTHTVSEVTDFDPSDYAELAGANFTGTVNILAQSQSDLGWRMSHPGAPNAAGFQARWKSSTEIALQVEYSSTEYDVLTFERDSRNVRYTGGNVFKVEGDLDVTGNTDFGPNAVTIDANGGQLQFDTDNNARHLWRVSEGGNTRWVAWHTGGSGNALRFQAFGNYFMQVNGQSSTIGVNPSNLEGSWFLIGTPSSGIGFDENEISCNGSDLHLSASGEIRARTPFRCDDTLIIPVV